MSITLKEILIIDGVTFGILIGLYFLCKNIPMNALVGYKTNRAFKSEKHWEFAQNYAFSWFLVVIPVQIITHVSMFLLIENWNLNSNVIHGVTYANICIIALGVIYSTEKKLSKM